VVLKYFSYLQFRARLKAEIGVLACGATTAIRAERAEADIPTAEAVEEAVVDMHLIGWLAILRENLNNMVPVVA
jgi:hypothetical protein